MNSPASRGRLAGPAIVLVEPQLGENIGTAARAMANFGLSDLRIVNPREGWPNGRAVAAASGAPVIDAVRVFGSVAEAIADVQFVYATTAREREVGKVVVGPDVAAGRAKLLGAEGRAVGVLFGRERIGLTNDEVSLADEILTLPVDPAFGSLNVAQAVLIVAYEWRRAAPTGETAALPFARSADPPAPKDELIHLFLHLESALDKAGFFRPPEKRAHMVEALRNMLQRAGLSEQEVRTLRGVVAALERRPTRPRLLPDGSVTTERGRSRMTTRLLVFDSGIGGLSVAREIGTLIPAAEMVYVADDAAFPYGDWADAALSDHVVALIGRLLDRFAPDAVVIACNTASTLVLPPLRATFHLPFVGTVPAIKPAAERTKSGMVSVLATYGTMQRDYTRELIARFAGACHVRLVGSANLAPLAEAYMRGEPVADAAILADVAPAFLEQDGRRTDMIVLACTHYPFLIERMKQVAPWPVEWVDPAPAIARRVLAVMGEDKGKDGDHPASRGSAWLSSGKPWPEKLRPVLAAIGLEPSATIWQGSQTVAGRPV